MENLTVKEIDLWSTWESTLDEIGGELENFIPRSFNAIYQGLVDGFTFKIAYSGGKDSSVVLGLFMMALYKAVQNGVPISTHHYLLHSNTGIENPEVSNLALDNIRNLEKFCADKSLPLKVYIAQPSLSSNWVTRVVGGRGLPTFANTKNRICTHDLKITGANRKDKEHKRSMPPAMRDKIVMLLGSRDAESVTRAENISRFNGSEVQITKSKSGYALYPIKSWTSANVWEFLTLSGNRPTSLLPSFLDDHFRTVDLYRDSSGGECVFLQTDQPSSSSACGSRHGCAFCLCAGPDKSMESLLSDERYSYMKGLNRIQRFLDLTRDDWSLRNPIGRTNHNGYIKLQPDVYSPTMLRKLLHAIITVDFLEKVRAEKVSEELELGILENNADNRRMSEPQFQIIDEQQLLAIEALWSINQYFKKPFEALRVWHSVYKHHDLEMLEEVETMTRTPKTPRPTPHWLKVGDWCAEGAFGGLKDQFDSFSGFEQNTKRLINTKTGAVEIMDVLETDLFDVNPEVAEFIVWEEAEWLLGKSDRYTSFYAVSHLLQIGALSIAKGQSFRYHEMSKRGQLFSELGISSPGTMSEILESPDLKANIITNAEFESIKSAGFPSEESEELQSDCINQTIDKEVKSDSFIKRIQDTIGGLRGEQMTLCF